MFEFSAWPKIPRLNRGMVITEKIDGTNACIIISKIQGHADLEDLRAAGGIVVQDGSDGGYGIAAQSRNRLITPLADNYGFAGWVHRNAETLVADLGVGYHFGEWWGKGIQRGYDQRTKRFSLFNERRWSELASDFTTPQLGVVPVLHAGPFSTWRIEEEVANLQYDGSLAAPGFMDPEGVVVYLPAARVSFKVMCQDDDQSKTQVASYQQPTLAGLAA